MTCVPSGPFPVKGTDPEREQPQMTRFLAKATSALSITLLLVQPGQLAAQGLLAPPRAKLSAPPGPDGLLQVQVTCAEDPTLPDCVVVPPAIEGAPETPPLDAPVVTRRWATTAKSGFKPFSPRTPCTPLSNNTITPRLRKAN